MSTTVDQRVVEMRFDNKQFENAVSNTMSTLDKLKQKLNLTGASKGLGDLNTAAKNVNMSGLGSAVESVSAKFSALQVMGVTALANITNSAVNAGKSIVKSLTIDPIKSGFSEYETKMGSIQTILANTEHQGTTLDDVTLALDRLNTYADKTIYNFQQMTKNIGTFTAAGVDLDTSVKSIQGIANLAAVSGSTSQQASTAMYQLSQALASGTVKLMDWNSVVNAGMGGKVFQNALIRTAAVMAGASEDVEAWQKENIDAHGSFRDSLTQGAWLTTDVLTKTLEQFTMAAEEGSEEWEAFKKSLEGQGYTSSQAEEILKMANTATDAATKVKTFTQLMDTLKESAQSGWAQTWETIVGDFEEAKEFFTELSDLFGGIIGESADRRNTLLSDALGSNYDKLITKISDAGIEIGEFEDSVRKVIGDKKLDSYISKWGSFEKVIKSGKISTEDLKTSLKGITKTAAKTLNFDDLAKKVKDNKFLYALGSAGDDVKRLQSALDSLGYDISSDGKFGKATYQAVMAFQRAEGIKIDGIIGEETIAALEKAGVATDELIGDVKNLEGSYDDLIDGITKKSGRELLLDSFMNIVKAIQRPLEAVGEAWRNTFSISSDQLYGALEWVNEFTGSLVMGGILDATSWDELLDKIHDVGIDADKFISKLTKILQKHGIDVKDLKDKYGSLAEAFEAGAITAEHITEALLNFDGISESLVKGGQAADKVRRTFEGLLAIFKIIGTLTAGPIKIAFNVFTKVLSKLGYGILDITATLGDGLVAFANGLDKVVDGITDFIVNNVGKWITKFKETKIFQTVAGWVESAAQTITNCLGNITDSFDTFADSVPVQKLASFGSFISDIAKQIADSKAFVFVVNSISNAFKSLKDTVSNFKLPDFNLDAIRSFAKRAGKIEAGSAEGIKGFFTSLVNVPFGEFKYNVQQRVNKALAAFASFWIKTGDKIVAAFNMCKEVATKIKEFVFGTESVDLPTILGVAEKFLGIYVLIQALKTIQGFEAPFEGIADGFNNLAQGVKWRAVGSAFKAMALALIAITGCIIVIASMPDLNKAKSAAVVLGGLLLTMAVIIAGIAFVTKYTGSIDAVGAIGSLLAVVIALSLLVRVISTVDENRLKDPLGTFVELFAMLMVLTLGVKMVAKAGQSSFGSIVAILTMITALKQILDVITAYDEFDWRGKSDAILGVIGMLIAISAALNIATRGVKSPGGTTGLALTLLVMIYSLKLLANAIGVFAEIPDDVFKKGSKRIAAIMAFIAAISAITLAFSNTNIIDKKTQKSVNNLAGLALALAVTVLAIYALGKLVEKDRDTIVKGGTAVGQILVLFTGMLTAIGLSCSGLKIGSIVTMLVAIGLLLAEITFIIKYLEKIPWQSSVSSAASMSALLLAMAGTFAIISKHTVKASSILKWMGTIMVLTGVIAALAYIIKQMSDVDPLTAMGSAAALGMLLLSMAACMDILTEKKNRPETIKKWVQSMIAMSLVVGILAVVLNMVKDVNPTTAVGNAFALGILLTSMALCMEILTKHRNDPATIKKWSQALYAMAGVMAILAIVLNMIKDVDPLNAIPNTMALIGLMFALAGVLKVMNTIKFNPKDMTGLKQFAILAASLTILVFVLSTMSGVENAIENATALSILAIALSVCMVPLSIASKMANGSMINGVLALGIMAAALTIVIAALSTITGIDTARDNAITLALLAAALSISMIPLALASKLAPGMTSGVVALAVLAGLLGILVWHLSTITDVETARANAITLANLAVVLSLCTLPLALASVIAPVAIVGAGLLVALAAILGVLVLGLSKISNVETARANADIIIDLLKTMTEMVLQIGALGFDAVAAVVAIGGMLLIVDKLGELAARLGEFSSQNENLGSYIDSGIELFKKISGGLGEMISCFGEGLTSRLPEIADNLTEFAVRVLPFVTTMRMITDDVVTRATNLAEAIQIFLTAGFMDTLGSMMGGSLSDMGTELSAFAANARDFINVMATIKPETASGMESFCNALKTLNEATSGNAWTEWWLGEGTMSSFGEGITSFAEGIKEASVSLADLTEDDVENIKRAASAGMALADLNNAIPKDGGLWQDIAGTGDLAEWGTKISAFADSLIAYSTKVSGTAIDESAIKKSVTAAQGISDLNASLPKDDGLLQDIVGAQDLATWGQKLVSFAQALVEYSTAVSGKNIDAEAIKASASAALALSDVNNAIPTSGGLWQAVAGGQDMAAFGEGLKGLALGLTAYATAAAGITDADIENIKRTGTAIDELNAVVEKLPSTGGVGGWLGGEKDPQAFGSGISALASGIKSYCDIAGTIDESKITSIETSSQAVKALSNIINEMPDTADNGKTLTLKTAVDNLQSTCVVLNNISAAGYDYTGVSTLQTEINNLLSMFSEVDTESMYSDFANLSLAVTETAKCAETIAALNSYTYGGIDTFKGALANLSTANVDGVINAFSGKSGAMTAAVNGLVNAMLDGFNGASGKVNDSVSSLTNVAIDAVEDKYGDFKTAGETYGTRLSAGMTSKGSLVEDAGETLGNKAKSGARSKYQDMKDGGEYLGKGFVAGVKSQYDEAYDIGYGLGEQGKQGLEDALKIQSPSRIGIRDGKYFGEGLVIGIGKMGRSVYKSGYAMGEEGLSGLSKSIARISDAINSDIDTQPTIRPVLDLSDVRAGASSIGDMFNANPIGLMTNVGTISTMMNRRSQNGAESEVVSAIGKLRRDLANMPRESYTIGNVSYDDGSNIKGFAQAIVRQARIERRS